MMGFGVGMLIMGLFGLLILVGIVVLIVTSIQYLIRVNHPTTVSAANDPLAQLQLRLVRGEITPEEYETLRNHLRN